MSHCRPSQGRWEPREHVVRSSDRVVEANRDDSALFEPDVLWRGEPRSYRHLADPGIFGEPLDLSVGRELTRLVARRELSPADGNDRKERGE